MSKHALAVVLLCLAVGRVCLGGEASLDLLKAKPEAVEAWKDMRFGMFITWGPAALTGREVSFSRGSETPIEEYDTLYRRWNPQKFQARQWVRVVKETGARYVIFLTKHHDGFCLWNTKQTDYNIMNSPFGRDVTKELAEACHKAGIGFFPYYSTCDWYHPDFPFTSGGVERPVSNLDRYTEFLEAQVRELITGYGPLVGIWFDVPQGFEVARGERVVRHVRSLQPDILVNNRTAYVPGATRYHWPIGDFDTPEQAIGRAQFNRPWESCIPLGTQWAWKPEDQLKSPDYVIQMLVACAVGDGNFALNTNPMADGSIEPRQIERFRKIGQWLKRYGESIYQTRGGPFVAPGGETTPKLGDTSLPTGRTRAQWWGGSTRRDKVIYLHVIRWPGDVLRLPQIKSRIVGHKVLTGGKAVVAQTNAGIEVSVPTNRRDPIVTIIKLRLDAPAHEIPILKTDNQPSP